MSEELQNLKSIIQSENVQVSPESFGGDLDPMCTCCTVCVGCVICAVCAGFAW
jgi:hypothetical protein